MNRTKTTTVERMAIAAMAVVVTISAPVLGAAPRVVPGEQRRWALDFRVRLEQPGGDRPIEIDLDKAGFAGVDRPSVEHGGAADDVVSAEMQVDRQPIAQRRLGMA